MGIISKLKSIVILTIILSASIVYAAIINEVTKTAIDLTIPLIFNGIAPIAVLGYILKKGVDYIKATLNELIETKNNHAGRLDGIEMIHQLRGCDQPDSMVRGRREADK